MDTQTTIVFQAAAIADAAGCCARPGAVALCNGRIVSAGPTERVRSDLEPGVTTIHLGDELILPALVNAHCHLELTAIGPQPYPGDFIQWVTMIGQLRPKDQPSALEALRRGARMCCDGGVAIIGDITSSQFTELWGTVLDDWPLRGVSFGELLGSKKGERHLFSSKTGMVQIEVTLPTSRDRKGADHQQETAPLQSRLVGNRTNCYPRDLGIEPCPKTAIKSACSPKFRFGLQPHAPYSTLGLVYQEAVDLAGRVDLPLCTHLAETPAELDFVAGAGGPFRSFLESLGVWDQRFAEQFNAGLHPVQWMEPFLRQRRWLLAHCNYVDDEHIALLAQHQASVAYCPLASAYFGHQGHGYRQMLEAGVNVCLGTDSIVCQPGSEPQPLGILPQMRWLYRRDHTPPLTLLAMATINGCRALGIDPDYATLQPGVSAGLCAVKIDPHDTADPLAQALQNSYAARRLQTSSGNL